MGALKSHQRWNPPEPGDAGFPRVTVPLVSEEVPRCGAHVVAEWFTGYRLDLVDGFGGGSREFELTAEIPGDEVPG